jgi:hypothetical protein
VLTALRLWSDKWVFGPSEVPWLVVDRDSGATLSALHAVDEHGSKLDPRRLHFRPGPGASAEDQRRLDPVR